MLFLAALLPLAGWGEPARAATLISDTFDTLASGANLNGRTPPINNGHAWVATTATFTGNGAGGLNANTLQAKSASIDLGGDLTNIPGVYSISADFTQPTGGSGSYWVAVGFASRSDVNQTFVGDNGAAYVAYYFDGRVRGTGEDSDLAPTVFAATGAAHNFILTLDTRGFSWTLNGYLDFGQLDLNGPNFGKTFTGFYNTGGIHYAALATIPGGAGGIATVDNFQLTGPLPEPGSALLMLAGLGITATRRRRRCCIQG